MTIKPPIAEKKPVNITLHNDTRTDNYAWLRDSNWQAVMQDPSKLGADIRTYLQAENDYTDHYMHDTKILQTTIFAELKSRIKQDDSSVPTKDGDYYYYSRYKKGAEHPCYCRYKDDTEKSEELLLDIDLLSKEHEYFSIGQCEHSPDHRYLAYATDIKGSEFYSLHVLDLTTGDYLPEIIENIQGDFVWAMNSQQLFYTTLDDNHRPDKVFRHSINSQVEQDILIYQENDPGFFVGLDRTESDRYILISSHDHTTSEVHYLDAHASSSVATLFQARQKDIEYQISDYNDQWFIHTNADQQEDYKIMVTPLAKTSRKYWQDYYLPKNGTLLLGIYLFKDYLIRSERTQGLPKIIVMQDFQIANKAKEYAIEFPEQAYELSIVGGFEFATNNLRFTYSSMTTPSQVFDFNMQNQQRELRKEQEVPSGHTATDYVTKRIFTQTEDGVQIPISILHHQDTPLNGKAPLLLYGYGSYGATIPASFTTSRLSLVNRGFIYAIAHIRGGMELGYHWYTSGKLKNKKNTFTDFISAANHLIAKNYTAKGNITIHGGSAGGMLIGACINQAPDLFRAAVADVPFVDVLNTMCDESLPLTPPEWPEWGNPNISKDDYDYIKSYSPYDQVRAQKYPHLLVTAGLTDPRVTYWEPAKWVAKLRALKTDQHTLLLKTNMEAGHAGASGRFDRLKEVALMYAFILKVYKMIDSHDINSVEMSE